MIKNAAGVRALLAKRKEFPQLAKTANSPPPAKGGSHILRKADAPRGERGGNGNEEERSDDEVSAHACVRDDQRRARGCVREEERSEDEWTHPREDRY